MQNDLARIRDVTGYVLLVCPLGALVAGFTQGAVEVLAEGSRMPGLWAAAGKWFIAHLLAGMVLTPLLLCWRVEKSRGWPCPGAGEGVICALTLLAAAFASFQVWVDHPLLGSLLMFLPFPLLVWASAQFTLRGAATGSFLVFTVAWLSLHHGVGPFAQPSGWESLLLVGSYAVLLGVTNLLLAASINERRLAGRALEKSQRMFNLITNNVTDLIAITDSSGHRLYNSASYDAVLGNPDLLRGTDAFLEVHPEDRERIKQAFAENLRTRTGQKLEFRFLLPSGEARTIESLGTFVEGTTGNPDCIVTVARDVTERRQTEEQLRKLSRIVEQSSASIIITNPQGRIEYVNPKFLALTGYEAEEVLGEPPHFLNAREFQAEDYEGIWQQLAVGSEWRGEYCKRKKCGEQYWVAATLSCIYDAKGRMAHYLAIEEDITARKQAEQETTRLETQLRQAQKMETIGRLAGGIAHDFNNMLASITGFTELAGLDLEVDHAKAREHLGSVLQAARSAQGLIQQILTFSRKGEPERKPIPLQPLVAQVIKLMRATLPKSIELIPRIDPKAPVVMADAVQIRQVLMNLCTNAAAAMQGRPGPVVVTLDSTRVDEAMARENPELSPGVHLRLAVTDRGHGMSAATIKQAFDTFFTTKVQGQGTGFGLSVVHGIVREHQGAVLISSEVNQGTTMQVLLPACERAAAAEASPETAPSLHAGRGERLLFVDDEPALCEMAGDMLKHLGYRVTSYSDPTRALEQFQRQSGDFDLVITDLGMPKMTGIDLARAVMGLRPDLPVILTTGYSDSYNEENIRALGIAKLLMKPFTLQALSAAIHDALRLSGSGPATVRPAA